MGKGEGDKGCGGKGKEEEEGTGTGIVHIGVVGEIFISFFLSSTVRQCWWLSWWLFLSFPLLSLFSFCL